MASTSNPSHVLEGIAQNRPLRPSRFVEEKKWPPLELIGNSWREKTRTNAASQSLVHQARYSWQPSTWSTESEQRIHQFHSGLCCRGTISGVSTTDFQPPFRLEVTPLGIMLILFGLLGIRYIHISMFASISNLAVIFVS